MRFYVYELLHADGSVAYVGKGSRYRLAAQKRNFGLSGHEVARFRREVDAYAFEIERIAEVKPTLNKHPGGNGSRAQKPRKPRIDAWIKEIMAVGTRKYAAQFLLARATHLLSPSELDGIRCVANG